MDYIAEARSVIDIEIEGLQYVKNNLGEEFVELVDLALESLRNGGRLVLTGVGKSGHIGYKLAATLSSVGSPSAFLNPVEALHGDLGMVLANDLILAISYSGETDELIPLLPAVKRFGLKVVALTGNVDSRLAKYSDLVLPMPIPREACPFNLAPTTSTTALLAIGDALAITLLKAQGFSQEQFGMNHPAGAIGRSVTLRIADVMRPLEEIPVVDKSVVLRDCLVKMTNAKTGSILIADDSGELLGIFTDGDFRRHVQESGDMIGEIMNQPISMHMVKNPVSIGVDQMAVEVMKILEQRHIDDIPVVDEKNIICGLIDIQDLPRFKMM